MYERGRPKVGGLNDLALGTMDRQERCTTDSANAQVPIQFPFQFRTRHLICACWSKAKLSSWYSPPPPGAVELRSYQSAGAGTLCRLSHLDANGSHSFGRGAAPAKLPRTHRIRR